MTLKLVLFVIFITLFVLFRMLQRIQRISKIYVFSFRHSCMSNYRKSLVTVIFFAEKPFYLCNGSQNVMILIIMQLFFGAYIRTA